MNRINKAALLLAVLAVTPFAACSGGGGGSPAPVARRGDIVNQARVAPVQYADLVPIAVEHIGNGAYILLGSEFGGTPSLPQVQYIAVKIDASGIRDTAFAPAGSVVFPTYVQPHVGDGAIRLRNGEAQDLAYDAISDRFFVLLRESVTPTWDRGAVVAFDAQTGKVDTGWGTNGARSYGGQPLLGPNNTATRFEGRKIAVGPTGEIFVAGLGWEITSSQTQMGIAVLNLTSTGSRASYFVQNGANEAGVGHYLLATSATLSVSDVVCDIGGEIYVSGRDGRTDRAILLRILKDASLDWSANNAPASLEGRGRSLLLDPATRDILMAVDNGPARISLVRFDPSGQILTEMIRSDASWTLAGALDLRWSPTGRVVLAYYTDTRCAIDVLDPQTLLRDAAFAEDGTLPLVERSYQVLLTEVGPDRLGAIVGVANGGVAEVRFLQILP